MIASCGGLFRDHSIGFKGSFAVKLGPQYSVQHAEIVAVIMKIESATRHCWNNLWIKIGSIVALNAFENLNLVPCNLRNLRSNSFTLG
jgi:hypothetical protein